MNNDSSGNEKLKLYSLLTSYRGDCSPRCRYHGVSCTLSRKERRVLTGGRRVDHRWLRKAFSSGLVLYSNCRHCVTESFMYAVSFQRVEKDYHVPRTCTIMTHVDVYFTWIYGNVDYSNQRLDGRRNLRQPTSHVLYIFYSNESII